MTTLLLNKVIRLILEVSFNVIIAVIKSTNNEILNINLELSFLKTPKTNNSKETTTLGRDTEKQTWHGMIF